MRLVRFVAAVSLLLVACGQSESEEALASPSQAGEGFAAALGLPQDQSLDAGIEELINDEQRNAIATCMLTEGFEWRAPTWFGSRSGAVGDIERNLTPSQYAQEYGFGVSAALGSGVNIGDPSQGDPNSEHLNSLSEQEAEAWQATVSDCSRDSYAVVDSVFAILDPFAEAEEKARELVAADSRVVSAKEQWSLCMAERGHPEFVSQDAVIQSLVDEVRTIPPDDETRLAEFAAREVQIAVDSAECRIDLDAITKATRLRIEEDLLESDERLADSARDLRDLVGS